MVSMETVENVSSSTVVVLLELMLSELRDIIICMQISSTINLDHIYPGT